jgi:hypothetical protein
MLRAAPSVLDVVGFGRDDAREEPVKARGTFELVAILVWGERDTPAKNPLEDRAEKHRRGAKEPTPLRQSVFDDPWCERWNRMEVGLFAVDGGLPRL